MTKNIRKLFQESIQVKSDIIELGSCDVLAAMGSKISKSIYSGNKLMLVSFLKVRTTKGSFTGSALLAGLIIQLRFATLL
jgi:hypothetical protein